MIKCVHTIILLLYFSLISSCSQVQEVDDKEANFTVSAKYPNIPDSTLVIMRNTLTDDSDTTVIINEKFKFLGKVSFPTRFDFIGINVDDKRYLFVDQILIENSKIELEKKDDLLFVQGSASNNDRTNFYQELRIIWKKYDSLFSKTAFDSNDSLILNNYVAEMKSTKKAFFINNQSSYFVAEALMEETMISTRPLSKLVQLTKLEIGEIYNGLSENLKNSYYGEVISRYIEMSEIPKIGDHYKDFSLPSDDENIVNLSDFHGSYILVDFWASWCVPCREENPKLKNIYEQYHHLDFEIISISIDKHLDKWKAAIKKDELLWTNVIAQEGRVSEVGQIYGINGIPDNLLIDTNGIIINRGIKSDSLASFMATIAQQVELEWTAP